MACTEDPLSLVLAAQLTCQCFVTPVQKASLQDRAGVGCACFSRTTCLATLVIGLLRLSCTHKAAIGLVVAIMLDAGLQGSASQVGAILLGIPQLEAFVVDPLGALSASCPTVRGVAAILQKTALDEPVS